MCNEQDLARWAKSKLSRRTFGGGALAMGAVACAPYDSYPDVAGSEADAANLRSGRKVSFQTADGTLDGEFWNGLVAELLVWNRALNDAELAKAWKHLGGKYGVLVQVRPPEPLTVAAARREALVQVCRVILNLNEFVYTD